MNAIVSFKTRDDREALLGQLHSEWAELLKKSYIPTNRPDAIFEGLTDEEYGRLERLVGPRGRVFADVKFEPFKAR